MTALPQRHAVGRPATSTAHGTPLTSADLGTPPPGSTSNEPPKRAVDAPRGARALYALDTTPIAWKEKKKKKLGSGMCVTASD